jgi:hypothetical protein
MSSAKFVAKNPIIVHKRERFRGGLKIKLTNFVKIYFFGGYPREAT